MVVQHTTAALDPCHTEVFPPGQFFGRTLAPRLRKSGAHQ